MRRFFLLTLFILLASLHTSASSLLSGGSSDFTSADPAFAACPPQSCSIPTFTVPKTFFGNTQLNFNNPLATTSTTPGYIRLWDTTCVWTNIETSLNVFTYTTTSNCDTFITSIINGGASPVFVFGRTPSWAIGGTCTGSFGSGCAQAPSDLNTGNSILSGMVTSLVTHLASTHPGTHWTFECVNEADLTGEWQGLIGTSDRIADLVTFCTALRTFAHAADSSIIVLGPSASTLNSGNVHLYTDGNGYAAKAGAAASLDAINIHAYLQSCSTYCASPDLLETWWNQVSNMTKSGGSLAGKPVWITEANWGGTPGPSGGTSQNSAFSAAQKRQYLARTYMYGFVNNVVSVIWYAFDSHPDTLTSGFGSMCEGSPANICTPNNAAIVYATLENWLVGSTYLANPCSQDASGTWTCFLQTSPASTGRAEIIWNGSGTHAITVSPTFGHLLTWDNSSSSIVANTVSAGPEVVMAIP